MQVDAKLAGDALKAFEDYLRDSVLENANFKAVKNIKKFLDIQWDKPEAIVEKIVKLGVKTAVSMASPKTWKVIVSSDFVDKHFPRIDPKKDMPNPYARPANLHEKFLQAAHRQDQLDLLMYRHAIAVPSRFFKKTVEVLSGLAKDAGLTDDRVKKFHQEAANRLSETGKEIASIAEKTWELLSQTTPRAFRHYLKEAFKTPLVHPDLDFPEIAQRLPAVKKKAVIDFVIQKKEPDLRQQRGIEADLQAALDADAAKEMMQGLKLLRQAMHEKQDFEDMQARKYAWEQALGYMEQSAKILHIPELAMAASAAKMGLDIFMAGAAISALGANASIAAIAPPCGGDCLCRHCAGGSFSRGRGDRQCVQRLFVGKLAEDLQADRAVAPADAPAI